jgi:NADPH:quinone reductase-like Zn-dependent oxidoreductase
VRIGGAIAQIGVLSQSSGQPGEGIEVPLLLHKQVHLKGIYVGSRRDFDEMNRAVATQYMKPLVDEMFSFNDAPVALRRIESGAHFGKLVTSVMH